MDKLKLDGEMRKEEEEAIKQVKGEALTEKEDPGEFVILIRLEAKINLNALADTGSDINVMPYRVYEMLGREEVTKVNWGITMDTPILVGRGFLYTCGSILNTIERITSTFDGVCHQTFRAAKTSLNTKESNSDDEEETARSDGSIQKNLCLEDGSQFSGITSPTITAYEAVADDELLTQKAIKFRLYGKAHSMSIVDFAKCLGLYTNAENQEDGFKTYFIGGLRNDDDFSYDKIQKNDLWLLSIFKANHQNGYANVTWLIAKWMKKKGIGIQRESLICYGQFVTRIAKRLSVLSNAMLNGLNVPTYCRLLDANTLRELICSNGRLIPEETTPSILRVTTPRAIYPTTYDVYDTIGQLEICIGDLERMMRRQSYHLNMYASVLEHIGAQQGITLRDPYNPPSYSKEQQQDEQE
ncbi:hypothetical protein Tco_0199050 [Tanacetum coccineum]